VKHLRSLLPSLARSLVCGTAVLLGLVGLAQAQASEAVPQQALNRVLGNQEVDAAHDLPTAGGLMAIESNGKLYIMSKNGRYLFDGTLRDLWHDGQTLDSMGDIERYALRLDLDGLDLDFDELVTAHFGKGQKQVTVFVTPDCDRCSQALNTLADMSDRYRVRAVVVPRPGQVDPVRRIDCANDPAAVLLGRASGDEAIQASCPDSAKRMASTLIASRIIGVDRVPYVVAPDGRVSHGMPTQTSLAGFLAGTEANQ